MQENDLIIYQNKDGNIIVDAIYKDDTLWLSQKGMSKVFECTTDNISLHLKHIFEEKELEKNSVTEKCSLTADDGKNYKTTIYKEGVASFNEIGHNWALSHFETCLGAQVL